MKFRNYYTTHYIFRAIVLLLAACPYRALAQPPCIMQHYSTDDGLSHSGVMCMIQDHTGFMWFGTWDGLNKFDGYKFTQYKSRPGDYNSLSHNRVDAIKEDRFGFLWVKTYDEKVHRFDRRTETFTGVPQSFQPFRNDNRTIKDIIETRSGEIWLTSENKGCYRVITDSADFSMKIFDYSEEQHGDYHLPSNTVYFIYEDKANNLWIGTSAGLVNLAVKHSGSVKIPADFYTKSFTCYAEQGNSVWFGTENGELIRFNQRDNEFSTVKLNKSAEIQSIVNYSGNKLIIGTKNRGLVIFSIDNQITDEFSAERYSSLGDNNIQSVYVDKEGLVWLETSLPGVVRFNLQELSFKRFTQRIDKVSPYVYYGDFYRIFEDAHGLLWISLKGGGFCYYNREKDEIEYFYDKPGSPDRHFSNLITTALSDSHGNLWLSTYSRGIDKVCFINDKFKHYYPSPNPLTLTSNEIKSIFEDHNQFLWVGTKEGKLYCYDTNHRLKKVFSHQTLKPGEINFKGMVYTMIQDKSGTYWFGTKGDGIIRATPVGNPDQLQFKVEHFRHSEDDSFSVSNNWIYNILQDSKDRIWIGTYGGGVNLVEVENGKTIFRNCNNTFSTYPRTICEKVRQMQEDPRGWIWVGTTNGLVVFDPNTANPGNIKFFSYHKEPGNAQSLANNDVHFVLKTKSGQMWVSTFGGGLGKVLQMPDKSKPPRFRNYTTADGLPIDIVLSMLEDKEGHLWLSTENGLSKFDPQKEVFTNFSELDGIKKRIFSEATCCKSKNGELLFGSFDGYYAFNPENISAENVNTKVVFVNLQLFNKDVPIGAKGSPLVNSISVTKQITLTHNQSVFSIEYAGLDFREPEKLEYAFILEGFEKEWNYVKHQRKATYTNLPAGKYIFKVKCTSSGKFDDKAPEQLTIIILPPWWKTTWAYLGYVAATLLILFVTYRILREMIKLRNKVIIEHKITDLKIKFFTNISHELRTPLTLILGPTEELLKQNIPNRKTNEFLKLIHANAQRMLRHVNQILDFRKTQTGKMELHVHETEIVTFVKSIFLGFSEQAVLKNMKYDFISDIPEIMAWIDREKVDTIIFNLLSNAFKFTPENHSVKVEIKKPEAKGYFEIIVSDTGVGIPRNDIPLIFDRFVVSNNHVNHADKGTGIGLSLVKELVEMHRGTVEVQSSEGEGSIFIVKFKLGKKHFTNSEISTKIADNQTINSVVIRNPAEIIPVKDGINEDDSNLPVVLIVEDNNDMRVFLRNILTGKYKIEEAVNGSEGVDKAKSLLPDIIISDVMMPLLDGIELTHKLKHDIDTSHIPIILLTARSTDESKIEGIKTGADEYIYKPFNSDFLVARIENLIEQRRRIFEKYKTNLRVVDLSPTEVVVASRDEQFVKDVMQIIENNMADSDFTVDKLVSEIGLGRTTFFKKLKSLIGMAPIELLRELRIKRGHQLLEKGEFSVSEVAYQIGFNDAWYFTKCFKERYGITPTELLKEAKKEKAN